LAALDLVLLAGDVSGAAEINLVSSLFARFSFLVVVVLAVVAGRRFRAVEELALLARVEEVMLFRSLAIFVLHFL
jgi:hypothetical protein